MRSGKVYKIIHNQSDIIYIGSTVQQLRFRWKNHKNSYKCWLKGMKTFNISIYPYFKKYSIENFKIMLIKEYQIVDKKHLISKEQLWINKLTCVNIKNSFGMLKPKHEKREYHKKNRDIIAVKSKVYREKNRDIIAVKSKVHYEENKEFILERQRIYNSKSESKIMKKETGKKYYEENKEVILEKQRIYNSKPESKIMKKETQRKYRENNREKYNKQCGEYREKNRARINEQSNKSYHKNKAKRATKVKCECGAEVRYDTLKRHRTTKRHELAMKDSDIASSLQ